MGAEVNESLYACEGEVPGDEASVPVHVDVE